MIPDDDEVAEYRANGFVVLRSAFDPADLSDEMDREFDDEYGASQIRKAGSGGAQFRCLPMMCERTPVSLALVDAVAPLVGALVGHPMLPVRAKGTRYFGSTDWHRDSELELDLDSVGIVAYLEPVDAGSGALQVQPGSHRRDVTDAPHVAVATQPGDLIVFDEHLVHGSWGGTERRQWRIDFVADPVGDAETARVHGYFARIFDPGWHGGYDPDRNPSYGAHWQRAPRPWVERLRELGVYELADAQESAMRAVRNG